MLIQRIVTGVGLVAASVAAIVYLNGIWLGIVFAVVWFLGAREWAGFARLGPTGTTVFAFVVVAAISLIGLVELPGWAVTTALSVGLAWWLIALFGIISYPRNFGPVAAIIAGLATLLPTWTLLSHLHGKPTGKRWILTLLVIVWSADIGAYLVGRSIGRHKLAPSVSPGKTWEGVIGGLALAGVAGYVASFFIGLPFMQASVLAVSTAAASVIGDLTVSMFKRNVGLKDSSHLLPGHGGILDRMDSLMSAVAVFFLGLTTIGLAG